MFGVAVLLRWFFFLSSVVGKGDAHSKSTRKAVMPCLGAASTAFVRQLLPRSAHVQGPVLHGTARRRQGNNDASLHFKLLNCNARSVSALPPGMPRSISLNALQDTAQCFNRLSQPCAFRNKCIPEETWPMRSHLPSTCAHVASGGSGTHIAAHTSSSFSNFELQPATAQQEPL